MNGHRALAYGLDMIFSGKAASAFPDHALFCGAI
jgi:hypothetical protein